MDAKNLMNSDKLPPLQNAVLKHAQPDRIELAVDGTPLIISQWNGEILRMTFGGKPENRYGMLCEDSRVPAMLSCSEDSGVLNAQLGCLSLRIENEPFRMSLLNGDKTVIQPGTDSFFTRRYRFPPFAKLENGWIFSFDLPFESGIYGFGEPHGRINQRGMLIRSYIEDALGVNSEHSYKNFPFCWSSDGWGMVIHTPAPVHHSAAYPQLSNRSYIAETEDPVLDLFLFAGDQGSELIRQFTDLTGKTSPTPDWALGFWTSRAYYKTEEELLEAASAMREKNLPCDVITLDGRAWQDTGTRMSFQWDPARYPDPQASMQRIKDLGYETACWVYPYMSVNNPLFREFDSKGWFLKRKDGSTYVFEWDLSPFGEVLTPLPDSAIYDFTQQAVVDWWKNEVRKMARLGVKCLKTDFAEQVPDDAVASNGDSGRRFHNVFTFIYTKITYEALCEELGPGEGMVWDRSAWLGSHRFPIQWCGDSQSDWGGMAASIISNLNYGLSGGAYYTYDIGGFYGEQPSPELFVRWTQAAVFTSHCRFHGIGEREPYYYGEEALNIVREWIGLRYRLIPYIKKISAQAVESGMPLCRAMVLAFPEEQYLHSCEFQYMFGDDLLIVPVIRPGGEVTYYLPPGNWYDFFSGDRIAGGRQITEVSPLSRIPVFVREGTVLPVGMEVRVNTKEYSGPVTRKIRIYGNPDRDEKGENYRVFAAGEMTELTLSGPLRPDDVEIFGSADVAIVRKS